MQPWLLFYYTGVNEENKYFQGVIHHCVALSIICEKIYIYIYVAEQNREQCVCQDSYFGSHIFLYQSSPLAPVPCSHLDYKRLKLLK